MTLSTTRNIQLTLPTDGDVTLAQASYRKLVSYLHHKEADCTIKVMLDDTPGEVVTIPVEALRLLVEILAQMGQGNAVQLTPIRKELELYEAADILGVSKAHLLTLLKSGEIPYRIDGTVYRMRYQDVIDYKNRNDAERMKVLDELAAEAQELNMGY
ncbi:MAG: helix-turn-helix domain-containing protein [Cyanobacteriota bacterium]